MRSTNYKNESLTSVSRRHWQVFVFAITYSMAEVLLYLVIDCVSCSYFVVLSYWYIYSIDVNFISLHVEPSVVINDTCWSPASAQTPDEIEQQQALAYNYINNIYNGYMTINVRGCTVTRTKPCQRVTRLSAFSEEYDW